MELFNDTLKAAWEAARPMLAKILGVMVVLALLWVVVFKIAIPSIFPPKEKATVATLEKVVETQTNTINVLQQANQSQSTSITQLTGAQEITNNIVGEIIKDKTGTSEMFLNNARAYDKETGGIKVDKALADQNTRMLIERQALQKKNGESTENTETLITQSLAARKALERKHSQALIDSLWSFYDEASK